MNESYINNFISQPRVIHSEPTMEIIQTLPSHIRYEIQYIESIQEPEVVIRLPKIPKNCWTKTNQVAPYWLFVKDIQNKFNVTQHLAVEVADEIWPLSYQKQAYKLLSRALKIQIKSTGYVTKTVLNALSDITVQEIRNIIHRKIK